MATSWERGVDYMAVCWPSSVWLGFNMAPKFSHYPEMEGRTFPLPAGGLAPGPSNPTGSPAGPVYPSGTCL